MAIGRVLFSETSVVLSKKSGNQGMAVRAIESETANGETHLFIQPGFTFRRTGALLTNFHLPKSSLLVLVCAFTGLELALGVYRHAVESGYRFFSYGDCMLIL